MKKLPTNASSRNKKLLKVVITPNFSLVIKMKRRRNYKTKSHLQKNFNSNHLKEKCLDYEDQKNSMTTVQTRSQISPSTSVKEKSPYTMGRLAQIYSTLHDSLSFIHSLDVKAEESGNACFGYLIQHPDLNLTMRAVLIDWIIELHCKTLLKRETLYLTVEIIDCFLSKESNLNKNKLQLVGVTALMIACKYVDTLVPKLRDVVEFTDGAYEEDQIRQMEGNILVKLDFTLNLPMKPFIFDCLADRFNFDYEEYEYCNYLLELSLLDYNSLCFSNEIVANSVIYLTLKRNSEKYSTLIKSFEMSNDWIKIRSCASNLNRISSKLNVSKFQALSNKYQNDYKDK